MATFKQLAVVSAVVITGGSAALMFSKESSPLSFWRRASDDPFAQHVERRVGGATWEPAPRAPLATAAITPTAPAPADPLYHQSMRPVGSLLAPIEGATEPSPPVAAPSAELPQAPPEPSASIGFSAGQYYHTVEDGDTLTSLAVRYLGRADGYRQIYELNRDVLRSPDLLPIGAVIKIPPRGNAVGAAGVSNVAPAGDITPWQAEPAGPMVPVPPRPLLP